MTTATATTLRATVDPVRLATALGTVCRAISTRTTLPILNNLRLTATAEGLSLTATNLEIGIRKLVPAEMGATGAITVPGRLLSDFVATLPPEPLALTLEDTVLHLECARFDTHIRCLDAADFPHVPQPDGGERLTLPLADLLRAIEQTLSAAATEESRPVLMGLLFEATSAGLRLVATNGHRLATRLLELPEPAGAEIRLIVPARALGELERAFRGEDGNVEVLVAKARNQVFFRCGGAEVASRVIDGQYPNYQQVIPTATTTTVRVPTKVLADTVRSIGLFARASATPVIFDVSAGQLVVSADDREVGDSRAELEATVEGAEVRVAFNAGYVRDSLAAFGEVVELCLDGPLSPTLFRDPSVSGDGGIRQVLMPVRLGGVR